jgi:hypothetical protein
VDEANRSPGGPQFGLEPTTLIDGDVDEADFAAKARTISSPMPEAPPEMITGMRLRLG